MSQETKIEKPKVQIDPKPKNKIQTLPDTFQDFPTQLSALNSQLESMSNFFGNFERTEHKKFDSERHDMNSYGDLKRCEIPHLQQKQSHFYTQTY